MSGERELLRFTSGERRLGLLDLRRSRDRCRPDVLERVSSSSLCRFGDRSLRCLRSRLRDRESSRAAARTFAQVALSHEVELVPGPVMSASGGERHEEYFRLPVTFDHATREEMVWRLARAWRELDRHGPVVGHPDTLVV